MVKRLEKEHIKAGTMLAFALLPISGVAVDVYVPSFPGMAADLHATAEAIKLTMTVYLISYGLSQLFVGNIIDSRGRYRTTSLCLLAFMASNIAIATTSSINLITWLRFVQGALIGTIVVCKRAFFIDVYSGDERKHYASLVTVVWATAPVLAPFLGGYLQHGFGWRSNFYFMALYALVMLLLELKYGGETLKEALPFHPRAILHTYKTIFSARDFCLGLIVLGFSFSMVIVFAMTIPFIVEHNFHMTPVITGYCALCSGVAIFGGGLFSRFLIMKPLFNKLRASNLAQLLIAFAMLGASALCDNIYSIMTFVVLLHFLQGFFYNCYFTHCITRFPAFAASASGITSGGAYVVIPVCSHLITRCLNIHDQGTLSFSYIILVGANFLILFAVKKALEKANFE